MHNGQTDICKSESCPTRIARIHSAQQGAYFLLIYRTTYGGERSLLLEGETLIAAEMEAQELGYRVHAKGKEEVLS